VGPDDYFENFEHDELDGVQSAIINARKKSNTNKDTNKETNKGVKEGGGNSSSSSSSSTATTTVFMDNKGNRGIGNSGTTGGKSGTTDRNSATTPLPGSHISAAMPQFAFQPMESLSDIQWVMWQK
jgi:hypothetical protein